MDNTEYKKIFSGQLAGAMFYEINNLSATSSTVDDIRSCLTTICLQIQALEYKFDNKLGKSE